MTIATIKRRADDFTEEEKARILERLKTEKPSDLAPKLNTSWQVLTSIKRSANRLQRLTRKPEAPVPVSEVEPEAALENALLKQQIKLAEEELEKLKAAFKKMLA